MPPPSLDWNDLKVLVAVAEQGNLKQAALELDVNPSTVWRKIQALEQRLGSQLLVGDRGGYSVTDNGQAVIDHARKMAAHAEAIQTQACATHFVVRGLIRVTAPGNLAWHVLPPLLKAFRERHPEVSFDLREDVAMVDVGRQEADIALRGSREAPDDTIAHFLRPIRWCVCGTPELAGADSLTLEEVVQRPLIGFTGTDNPAKRWLNRHARQANTPVHCNSVQAAYRCALEGIGLAILPENHQWNLSCVYTLPSEYDSGLWILTHPEMRNAARIRAFWDFLIEALSSDPASAVTPSEANAEHRPQEPVRP
ncbi:LysR family transcriptional regulator [Saccharospirillum salsuginis]|uniref:LysR family transcriptional regulator n=1 Tax=Saccharospirillum salsuginis TaxID=418750 RepID=A0A918NCK1_9GAMM|nr:LysR family transcriptional regulator [Saccharospirillum salsuginis]GGX57788.1 LysR family transcriptional regulator [Saccharospirillum salsuginis]